MAEKDLTFWNHLDELRKCIIHILLAIIAVAMILFIFKDALFSIVLAPKESSFITYSIFNQIATFIGINVLEDLHVDLINTQLANQFLLHVKVTIAASFIITLPYLLYSLFTFVSPALYKSEKKYTRIVIICGYTLFLLGALLSYFLIFPLTFRFLGTYQVSQEISNVINLDSYIDTFFMLCTMMGILFEMPIIAWLLAKIGLINSEFLSQFRRHAIVAVLIIAAIITPTSDIFTLSIVSLPIYLLYEISIRITKITHPTKKKD
jgi:sec-independent protein translocase protein TatC